MKKDNVEIFDETSIVTLYDDEQHPVDFYEIAGVEYNDKLYELLQPTEPMEGLEDNEVIIFEVQQGVNEEESTFLPIGDEDLLNEVFAEYVKVVSDLDGGCDCCGCGDDCDCDDECEGETGECHCGHHHDHK